MTTANRMRACSYTLLEVVVALAIFAAAMSLVGMGVGTAVGSWERIGKAKARLSERLVLDCVANGVLRNAIPFTWLDRDTRKELPVFRGDREFLRVAARSWIGDASEGGMRFATIEAKDGKLIVRHSKIPMADGSPEPGDCMEELVASNVSGVSFKYADRDKDRQLVWLDDWDDGDNQNLPLAIQMTVEWRDGTSESWLRRTAGSGARESLGMRKVYVRETERK